jgi:hypothetical protein
MKKNLAGIIIAFFLTGSLSAVSVDQAFMKNALDDNRLFIDFINVHVSNFANEEYLVLFRKAAEYNFISESYYLSGDYKRSFENTLEVHRNLRELYYKILTERYEKDTEELLKMSTTIILMAKDKSAEYSLKMGYGNLARGIHKRKYGFGVSKQMLSQKIKIYMEAVNSIIRAKRYAMIAIIESTIPLIDKKDYKKQTIDEALKNVENIGISDYEYLRNEIINNINKKALPEGYPFLLHHDDNYNQIGTGEKSALNKIGDEINKKARKFESLKDDTKPAAGDDEPSRETP